MHKSGNYRVERLSFERLADMARLHTAVYGKVLPPDFYQRKYNTTYTGATYTGFLAYDKNNEPVAFYGVIPCFIEYCDQLILSAQSADTMTHPGHRDKGLFVELANLTYELCRKEGIRIIFGFPNQNSLPGFVNKLGWQITAYMDCFTIPVKAMPLEKIVAKFPTLKNLHKAYINKQLKTCLLPQKGAGNSLIKESFGGVYRDDDYLQYKTYSDTYVVNIGPACIWFKVNNGLIVGDITNFEHDFDNTVTQLKLLAAKLGLHQIQLQANRLTKLHGFLMEYAQAIPSFPVIIKDLGSNLQVDKIAFTFADIDIF